MPGCCGSSAHKRDSKWSWVVCLSALFSNAVHMGIANSFAVIMPVLLDQFHESKERAGWLGSIAVTLTFLPTPLAGMFCGRFGCRITSLVGTVTCAAGLVLTSFANSLLVMYFTYSVMFGIGACFIHTGCVFAVTMYFDKRRSLATGIIGASQSMGIITLAPVLQELIAAHGWRNMYRILAALFGPVLIAVMSFSPNVESGTTREVDPNELRNESEGQERKERKPKFTCEMFKRPAYIIAVLCVTLGCFGTLVAFVHLITYCEEMGVPAKSAANLFIFIGVSSLVSSVISGRILDIKNVSPFYVNQFANIVLACSLILLPQARTYTHFVIFAVSFGVGFGSFITTIYLLLLNTVEPRLRLYAFPVGETVISAGTLGGAPLAGFIADLTGSYVPAFYCFGAVLLFAALLSFPVYLFGLHKVNRDPRTKKEVDGLKELGMDLGWIEEKKQDEENEEIGAVNEALDEDKIHCNGKLEQNETEMTTIDINHADKGRNEEFRNGYDNSGFVDTNEGEGSRGVNQELDDDVINPEKGSSEENGNEETEDMAESETRSLDEDVTTKF